MSQTSEKSKSRVPLTEHYYKTLMDMKEFPSMAARIYTISYTHGERWHQLLAQISIFGRTLRDTTVTRTLMDLEGMRIRENISNIFNTRTRFRLLEPTA